MVRFSWLPLVISFAFVPASCGLFNKVTDSLATCTDVCVKIQECNAEPPVPEFGSLGAASSGQGGLDCAAGCSADDAAMRGYSDCQLECVAESDCGVVNDCWKPKTETYAKFCLDGVTIPQIHPPADDPPIGNGSVSGSSAADDLIEDPAVAIAVDDAGDEGFEINFGDSPPELIGKYRVEGQIDSSSNARPVGSLIRTSICFWDYAASSGGVKISYCEDGVPGEDTAPLTGSNDAFTAYFEYDGQATVLFSGSVNNDGTLSQVEALVVYTYATGVWELSHTDWEPIGDCASCN